MWKKADILPVSADQRLTLQTWIAAGTTPQRVVFRARIALLAAEGISNCKIAEQLRTSRPTVILWRRRFAVGGPAALVRDAAGRGRKRRVSPEQVEFGASATEGVAPASRNCKDILETVAAVEDSEQRSRLVWEDYPNYAARMEFLLALRNHWPKFWRSLKSVWQCQDPARLEQWTREYHVINEDERVSNLWLLEDVVRPTLEYWSASPDSPNARLQPSFPWFCYPADRFLPFPEFRPVLTDARPKLIPLVPNLNEQIAEMQQRPLGDAAAGRAAIAELRSKSEVEPDEEFQDRILKQVKRQLAGWNRAFRKNIQYSQVTPQLRAHARWAVRRMRGDSLEDVAASEPNSSFLFRSDGDKAQTIVRQVRRFTREADIQLPRWASLKSGSDS
jgi:transposase